MPVGAALATNRADRVLFSLAGLWFIALTLLGFSRSFYFRTDPDLLPTHQALHGVVFSAWVLLFFVQVLLISTRRVRWHLRLGAAGLVVLLVMIPFGFHVVLAKTAAGLKSVDEAGFNLAQLTLGFVLAFSGLALRRRPAVHKRLMLFATLMFTVAAADRVSSLAGLDEVRLFRKLLAIGPGLALVGYDAWRRPLMLPLSLGLLALVWLLLWFLVSDLVFMRPIGGAIVRTLTTVFVWY